MNPERPDAAMVEIGSLDDDSAPEAVAPPHVVIHYRERGIPWLLVPPLIALSGAIAVVAAYSAHKYLRNAPAPASGSPSASTTNESGGVDAVVDFAIAPPPTGPTDVFGLPIADAGPGLPPLILAESPGEIPLGVAAAPVAEVPAAADPVAAAMGEAVAPVGFDPATLLPGAAGGGPVDAAVASTRLPGDPSGPAGPGPEAVEPARADPPQPAGVPADVLPPDPRDALRERRRLEAEQWQLREQERFQFQRELRAVCRERGDRAAPDIQKLVKAYNSSPPPGAMEQANKLFGKTGYFARLDLPQRIVKLRQIGFPEPVLIGVIYDYETSSFGKGARDAPSPEMMYLRAARVLLNNPPGRPASAAPRATAAGPATAVPSAGPPR